MKKTFICATYNEQYEIVDLLTHVSPHVDYIRICDDGSTDATTDILKLWEHGHSNFEWKSIPHTGLPETVKNEALKMAPDNSWIIMLDADERFDEGVWSKIDSWLLHKEQNNGYSYMYFNQKEIIDDVHVRTFQKCKLFRKEAIKFSSTIHEDDQFTGEGIYLGWTVLHRKSSDKQRKREEEYLETYKKLLSEGKIDEGRYEWLRNLHHFVK